MIAGSAAPNDHHFAGEIALVTGAASGIGRASALAFARRGAIVVVADRDPHGATETVELVHAAGGRAEARLVDVSDEHSVAQLIDAIVSDHGRLDIAHNNAGVGGPTAAIADTTTAGWQQVIDVNLGGVFFCLRAELRVMREQGRGRIVNTASIAGLTGPVDLGAYAASKAGVIALTKVAALEHAADGIRVNAVAPGFVHTPMTAAGADPDWAAAALAAVPAGRGADPAEIAEAVVWLTSPAADFLVGHVMVIDGGLTVGRPRRRDVGSPPDPTSDQLGGGGGGTFGGA